MKRATRRRRPSFTPARALSRLAALTTEYHPGAAVIKLELLRFLETSTFRSASQVAELHEALCFIFAYPDDEQVFAQAERMLRAFEERIDLRRCRHVFENTGIAGTDIVYPFSASTARWLTERWGDSLTVAWGRGENETALETRLPLLTLWSERAVFDEPPLGLRDWLETLRGADTDAAFLVRRSAACTGTAMLGDQLYDELNLTLRLVPGAGTPARTGARFNRRTAYCQTGPLRATRPDLTAAVEDVPRHIADVSRRDAERLIDLAREAMVTRERDLYSFAAADPRDVRMIDCGDGLELACFGVQPEQRLMFDAVYSFLLLRNGVPIGYALTSALWRSSEIAYNVFETYRNAEAAWIYGRLLAVVRSAFNVDTFTVFPYQLGHGNDEGIGSGAWWFYYKLGFRPRDRAAAALARREADRVKRRRSYRTGPATLRRLVRAHLFFQIGDERSDVIGAIPTDRLGLRATGLVAARFGADRERAAMTLASEAADRLGVSNWRQWPAGERLFWERWAPVVALLADVDDWSTDDKRALVDVIRAKGGQRESDFVVRFDAHPRLGAALVRLAQSQ